MTFQTLQNNEDNRYEPKRTNLENELRSSWLGRRDSNPRMLGPKPSALPLGHSPSIDGLWEDALSAFALFARIE